MSKIEKKQKIHDVIIIGGGLSGLVIADHLHNHHNTEVSWCLLEARSILGGRIFNGQSTSIDLGAAWIWPSAGQRHITDLASRLGIKTFHQPDDPMSTRLVGGALSLIHKLKDGIPEDCIRMNSPVVQVRRIDDAVTSIETSSGEEYLTRKAVFAAPPRLLHKNITFDPPLSQKKRLAMSRSNTWMAGVTKVALLYPKRFWPLRDGISNTGLAGRPAFQVYDGGSSKNDDDDDDNHAVLTFFTIAGPHDNDEILARKCSEQMAKMWSAWNFVDLANKVSNYSSFIVKRWPLEEYISEDPNPQQINPHPMPVTDLAEMDWDGMLHFAGTESDLRSPGVMEGAVASAMRVVKELGL